MTKSELLSLLRDAESVLWDAVCRNVSGAEKTHQRIARALRAEDAATPDGTCASCGNALTQPSTGRPRTYCGGACKKRAQRARARGTGQ
ncbi:hypothetical protein TPA0910_15560 [Streptomyces hygroscopicus subsp. sporocinereus]|uniref:DksA C4-type domain-containing protein n=1 Tax=Streptomyces hygroscopicus TaxID=1912 RepID=A0ABQ3TUW8_STRHY|nr:hypothetical protein TPA0910_15560 [Streptomyces hygroscopicus]